MSGKFSIITYGCQMNEHDSEIMEGLLAAKGMTKVDDETKADVVIYNTCMVREGAETRAVDRCRTLLGAKRHRSDMVIVMAGCVAQEKGVELLNGIPHLDIVVGTRDYIHLPEIIEEYRTTGKRVAAVEEIDSPLSVNVQAVRRSNLKAHVNIMYGCNNRCAFCIVPKTRGTEWSRPLEEVVNEVKGLAATGYREVLLLGQNVNSYRDEKKHDFADLLYALNEIDGLWRIRYTSPNPKDARDRHVGAIAECEKVMENLHLPLQSGSDNILRKMRRSYNTKRFRQIVEKYRAENPFSSLSTDIIVGFPTETEEEFMETFNLMREIRFDTAFMFIYSPRPGTEAASTMPNDVPMRVKKDRLKRLIDQHEAIAAEINQSEIGKTHQVLVEGSAKKDEGYLQGRTRTDKMTVFPGNERLIGQLVDVEVTDCTSHTLIGKVVTNEPVTI